MDTRGAQEASETLQSDSDGQKCQLEREAEEDKHGSLDPQKLSSSVHFFPRIVDSDSTTMPESLSLSLSQDMPFSNCVDISRITLSSLAPLTSKTTLTSGSRADSLGKQSMNFSPAKKQPVPTLDPDSLILGEGEDYFLSLFGESRKLTAAQSPNSQELFTHLSVILEEVGKCTTSSLGDIQIAEVDVKGLFVKILNCSSDREVDIGRHILQQNVDGHPISMYQFRPNIPMQAHATVTVWAAAAEAKHQPPTDFVWKEQDRFRSSPDCTTILCQPHGEAVAWYTPIHWKQVWEKLQIDIEFDRCSIVSPTSQTHMFRWATSTAEIRSQDKDVPPKKDPLRCQLEQPSASLTKEKETPPTLFPNRSPWCRSPSFPAHPYCPLIEPVDRDTAERTSEKQLQAQSARPVPTPGVSSQALSPKDIVEVLGAAALGVFVSAGAVADGEFGETFVMSKCSLALLMGPHEITSFTRINQCPPEFHISPCPQLLRMQIPRTRK
uniref:lamin tail domain-containing protein 1 n=1 Tax=Jaculus jaculus TaxID=51337 RepID=UPI001E1AFB9E|nr:lamin tail domain-containing protein 1 [Jaculus jaculus]